MKGTVNQQLSNVFSANDRLAIMAVAGSAADRLSCKTLSSPGLVIKAGASPTVKAGNLFRVLVKGSLRAVAANTDMAALAGTVANGTFNVFVFFINQAGVTTTLMGQAATTLPNVVFPEIPQGNAMVGFIIVNPTGTGAFVGGTTALDDATVVPNVVYQDTTGSFDPTLIVN